MMKKKFLLLLVLFLIATYFPLFLHLDVLPLRMFDESRVGMNAMQMAEKGNWLVPHYNTKPDMWNLKPPLMVWLQVAAMKVLGYNTLAVRLPSALAGLATILLLLWFGVQVLKNKSIGFFSALVLLTTPGFVSIHVTRTGEYDALLCFFLMAYSLCFFRFLHDETSSKERSLNYFGLFLTLSILTKSIAGLFFLPGLFIYTLVQKKMIWVLRQRHTYFVALSTLAIVFLYYFGREMINPGYLQNVIDNEWSGRFKEGLENHQKPFLYYIKRTFTWQFRPWIFYLPLVFIVVFKKNVPLLLPKLILCFSIISLVFFLVISTAQTKLGWYNAPAFPPMALLVGIAVAFCFEKLLQMDLFSSNSFKLVTITSVFVLLIYGYPYREMIKKVYLPKDTEWNKESMRFETFMKKNDKLSSYKIASDGYNSHLDFHVNAAIYNGKNIKVVSPYLPKKDSQVKREIDPGNKVVFCEERIEKVLRRNFIFQEKTRWQSCALIEIIAVKTKK